MKINRVLKVFFTSCISISCLFSTACGYIEYAGIPYIKTVELADGGFVFHGGLGRKACSKRSKLFLFYDASLKSMVGSIYNAVLRIKIAIPIDNMQGLVYTYKKQNGEKT